jgi:ABC-type antimicrobial peptide transport system permease subunit
MSGRHSDVFDELQGSFFSGPDAPEAIILSDFGRELLGLKDDPLQADQKLTPTQSQQLLGKNLTLLYAQQQAPPDQSGSGSQSQETPGFNVVRKEQKLKIVGIVNTEPYGAGRGNRARVLLPMAFAESLNMIQRIDLRSLMHPTQGKSYFALMVRVARSSEVSAVEDAIKKDGYSTFSILDASKGITRFFTFLDLFLGIFGSLALAVASLGIVNTLVMAILERRREIGIMKAIGASDGDVQKIFFCEAGTMGLFGGTLGVLLGWIIGRVINFGTNIYLVRQQVKPENFWYVPWWLVAAALGFSIIVSLLAGLYPAARAARLDPVKALRHE